MTNKKYENTLVQLWMRRHELSQLGWNQLYQLMCRVLKRGHYSELESLPLPIKDYIDDFFCEKVFFPTQKENFSGKTLFHENALITFFHNYLKDKIDEIKSKREIPLKNEDYDKAEKPTKRQFKAPQSQDDAALLRQAGLNPEQIMQSARQFIQQSQEWVRLYLALHTCADQTSHLSLSQLAKNYQIPSYHHRARQLGITRKKGKKGKKGEFERGYGKTLLGKWLLSLGISAHVENKDVIEVAFKILCWEALLIEENK